MFPSEILIIILYIEICSATLLRNRITNSRKEFNHQKTIKHPYGLLSRAKRRNKGIHITEKIPKDSLFLCT